MANYYEILGVSSTSSEQEIKSAYKRLALKYHPDKNPGDLQAEEKFKEINNAYQVLSNPYRKAQYDILMTFSTTNSSTTYSGTGYTAAYATQTASPEEEPPKPKAYYRRKPKTRRRYSKEKEEKIAMMWMAGFLAAIFFVVFGAAGISSYKEKRAEEERYRQKMAIFGKAISYFEEKDYGSTLQELETIIRTLPAQRDQASVFKQEVIQKLRIVSEEQYEKAVYEKALEHLLLLYQHETVHTNRDYSKIAYCYRKIGDYENAILMLKKVIENDEHNIVAYTTIGDIYCTDKGEYALGMEFYNKACNITINDYQQTHGSAFSMLVSPNVTPDSHYALYVARATAYHAIGQYKKAIEDLNWATFLRPQKAEAFALQGDSYQALGRRQKACAAWQEAAVLGSQEAVAQMNEFCR